MVNRTASVFNVASFGDEISVKIRCEKVAGGRSHLSDEMVDILYASDIECDDIDYLIDNNLVSMFRRDADHFPVIESFIVKNMLTNAANNVGGQVLISDGPQNYTMSINRLMDGVSVVEYNIPISMDDGSYPKCGRFEPVNFIHQGTKEFTTRFVEVFHHANVAFTIASLRKASDSDWARIMTVAEDLGIGAARNHGYGKFNVVKFSRKMNV